jgi:hypothetical protein
MKRVSMLSGPASVSATTRSSASSFSRRRGASHVAGVRRGFEQRGCFGFEIEKMRAQRGRGRDAEDEVETIPTAKIHGFARAVMAFGAQQDLGFGPIGSDVAQEVAKKAFGLFAAGALGLPRHGRDETSRGPGVTQVLDARDRRLRRELSVGGREVERHLEHGIGAEGASVVGVFIPRGDPLQAEKRSAIL